MTTERDKEARRHRHTATPIHRLNVAAGEGEKARVMDYWYRGREPERGRYERPGHGKGASRR